MIMIRRTEPIGAGADTDVDVEPFEDLFEANGIKLVATAVGIDVEHWASVPVDSKMAERAVFQRDESACAELIRVAKLRWGGPRVVYVWGDDAGWLLANPTCEPDPSRARNY
jgi:hypothetical protein